MPLIPRASQEDSVCTFVKGVLFFLRLLFDLFLPDPSVFGPLVLWSCSHPAVPRSLLNAVLCSDRTAHRPAAAVIDSI